MVNLGKNIRLHRIKKGWTQEELAAGLISVSYLSKIENNLLTASPDIIDELFLRLEIQDTTVNEIELNNQIKSWYQIIVNRDLDNSSLIYHELSNTIKKSNSFYSVSFYNLISIRYFLAIADLKAAEKIFIELCAVEKEFTSELLFLFHKFKGTYEYLNNNFEEAYSSYKQAESLLNSSLMSFERADVFYSIGLVTTRLLKPYLAIYYTNQALELFRGQYLLHRCSDCHLLLGVLFQRMKEYDDAVSHYQWASKLAKEVNYHSLFVFIEHNMGFLYFKKGEFTKSLQHYERSLELGGNESSKLHTLICIMKICFEQNFEEQLRTWVTAAEPFIDDITSNDSDLLHEYIIFKHLAEQEYESFINYSIKVALPYFKKHFLYENSSYYSALLAEHFKENRKYKQSSFYFEYCKKILNKHK